MFRRHERSRHLRRSAACFLVALLASAGLSFGQGRIEKGSSLAGKIERTKRIRVHTPRGGEILLRPTILDAGIASRVNASGEELEGSYNEATLIPWDDVHEIQVRKSAAQIGALKRCGVPHDRLHLAPDILSNLYHFE